MSLLQVDVVDSGVVQIGLGSLLSKGQTRTSAAHRNTVGEVAHWTAEIRGLETDMPGTVQSPAYFDDCKFYTGFYWINGIDSLVKMVNDDRSQWIMTKIDDNSWSVLDRNPLPQSGARIETPFVSRRHK